MLRKSSISKLVLIALSMVVVSPLAALAQGAAPADGASCPAPDQAGAGGGGRRHGRRGGMKGNMDPAKRQAMKAKMVAKFDKNGDGQLDDNEKAAMKQFRQERKAKRQAMQNGSNPGPGSVPPPGAQ